MNMGDIYYLSILPLLERPPLNAGGVWTDKPTYIGVFVYSIATPSICLCGIIGNFLCLIVLSREEFVNSFYVYLRVLATMDLTACCVVFLSGLARGILWWRDGWATYDALIGIPLGVFLSYISTIATVFVTIDRVVYLKNPLRRIKPRFCKRRVAIKIIASGVIISLVCTIPYCFIYKLDDGVLEVTNFYKSRFYAFWNWFDLSVFAILPLILLSVGNTMLLSSIRTALELQRKCQLLVGKVRKMKDQSKITITLTAIVFFYLIGEVPTHLTARKTAANLLFGGDYKKADCSVTLEIFRQITTVLNSVHLASKFILYCLFCPPFCRALKKTITGTTKKKEQIETRNMPVELFVCNKHLDRYRQFKLDMYDLGFMNIFINTKAAQELPRIL